MATKKTNTPYAKAPIIEAIIDISVQLPEKSKFAVIEKFCKSLKTDFPITEEIYVETGHIETSANGTKFSSNRSKVGLKLTSNDKSYVIQVRENGISFSIVGKYESWPNFSAMAKKLWKGYNTALKPIKVNRVATRYINRIDIPSTSSRIKLEDYFETYPRVLKNNKSDLSAFFLQVQLPQKKGGFAILSQSTAIPPGPGYISITLDIDVFEVKNFPPTSDDLWKRIALLRLQKNDIFEKSITDATRELFV